MKIESARIITSKNLSEIVIGKAILELADFPQDSYTFPQNNPNMGREFALVSVVGFHRDSMDFESGFIPWENPDFRVTNILVPPRYKRGESFLVQLGSRVNPELIELEDIEKFAQNPEMLKKYLLSKEFTKEPTPTLQFPAMFKGF